MLPGAVIYLTAAGAGQITKLECVHFASLHWRWEAQKSETGHSKHLYFSRVIICDLEVIFYLFY